MEQKQLIAIGVVVIVLVAAIGVGWYLMSGNGGNDEPVDDDPDTQFGSITDAAGNEVQLTESPQRIVSTTVTATEMLCNLGFRNVIVGATTDSGVYDVSSDVTGIDADLDYPATLQSDLDSGKITNIGTWYGWTAESVAAAEPDLVVMDYNQIESDDSRMTQLQSLGITCIVTSTEAGIGNIVANYEMLGTALGVKEKAEDLGEQIAAVSAAISDEIDGYSTDLKVAHICYCYGSYYIYDMSATMQVLIDLGCTNALPTTQSFTTITTEDIAAADVDLIIFDDMSTGLNWDEVIAQWKADPVMGSVDAIANDRFFCLEYGPFQATSYDTVHFVEGQALLTTLVYADELGVDVPLVITDEAWRGYVQWVDDVMGESFQQVTDAAGNTVQLSSAPSRIVSTTVTAAEMISNLGYRSALVGATTDPGIYDVDTDVIGISAYLDYPATIQSDLDAGRITNVGTFYGWTAESVAAANPDLVIMEYNQIESDNSRLTQLQSLGVTCIVLNSDTNIDAIIQNYTMLGAALAESYKAEVLCSQIEGVTDVIADHVSTYSSDLKVAHICYCYGSYYIYNTSTQMEVLTGYGCTNALPTAQSFTTITTEDIAAADIDLIIFDDMGTYLDWDEVIAQWKADPVMGSIDAIANDRFYCMEYSPFQSASYNTVHFVEGYALLTTLLFGDEIGVDVPVVVTSEDWKSYIQWVGTIA